MLATLSVPSRALACSGPGAAETILRNERLGWALWAMTLVIAGVFAVLPRLRARGWRKQWPLLLLVLLHPGWWMSARSGDCGRTLWEGSILMMVVTLLAGGAMYWRAKRATAGAAAQDG